MQKLSKSEVKRGLKNSIRDGAFTAGMDGITGTYTTPYALALGATDTQIGFLSSIPRLFIILTQPLAGKLIERSGKIKNVCNNSVLISRLLWIPILLIPFIFFNQQVWWLIFLFTISQVIANIGTTAWITWMGDIVPEKIRGTYFGKRNMIASIISLVTTLGGGYVLGLTKDFTGFATIFFLALLSGLVSNYYLKKIPANHFEPHKVRIFKLPKFEISKHKGFFNFTIHRALTNFSVWIAAPFFTVYMLNVMNIGYIWYSIVVALEIVVMIVSQRYWGRLADKFGDRRILLICNIIIIFYPLFWLFIFTPSDIGLILIAAILSGFGWSGFDLATFNYLLDSSPVNKRPTYVSNYKLLTSIALFVGPLVGGYLAQSLTNVSLLWISGLQILFLISLILRGASAAMFLRFREVRVKTRARVKDIFLKVVAIYPMRGIVHEIVYAHHYLYYLEKKLIKRFKSELG